MRPALPRIIAFGERIPENLPRPVEAAVKRVLLAVLFLVLTSVVVAFAGEQTASPVMSETYWPTHGWRSSTPEAQGMDSEALAQAFEYIRQRHIPIHSLLCEAVTLCWTHISILSRKAWCTMALR